MSVSPTHGLIAIIRAPGRSEVAAVPETNRVTTQQVSSREESKARSIPAAQNNTRLTIEHDKATNRYIFKTINKATGEVTYQYPTELMLSKLAHSQRLVGVALDTGA